MGLNLGLAAEDTDVVDVSVSKFLREEEVTPARAGMCFYKRTLTVGWPGLACLVRELHHKAWVPFSMSDIQSTSQNCVHPTSPWHGAWEAAAPCSCHCSRYQATYICSCAQLHQPSGLSFAEEGNVRESAFIVYQPRTTDLLRQLIPSRCCNQGETTWHQIDEALTMRLCSF